MFFLKKGQPSQVTYNLKRFELLILSTIQKVDLLAENYVNPGSLGGSPKLYTAQPVMGLDSLKM